jgi:hypothetical protein
MDHEGIHVRGIPFLFKGIPPLLFKSPLSQLLVIFY